jgi:hypothetical protein
MQSAEMNSKRYSHPTASQQQFMADKYTCLQQTQQDHSAAFANGYGGSAVSGARTNWTMFSACMGARGYREDPNGHLGG